MASTETPQRIAKLTPLAEVLAAVDRLARPVPPRTVDLDHAAGRVLAADVAPEARIAPTIALRDGWAVRSDLLLDASAYAPVPVSAAWVEAGDPLPDDTDAVLPPDAVIGAHGGQEAIAPATPGEGILRAMEGGEAEPLRRAGVALRAVDIAALRAAGVRRVEVREPRVNIVSTNRQVDAATDTAAPLLAAAVEAAGGRACVMRASTAAATLEIALRDEAADAVMTIGGTGEGRGDRAVAIVAGFGEVVAHGMGIRPGETAALAEVGGRPVFMLPGRLDAALAAWLLVGRHILRNMTGATAPEQSLPAILARKVVSTIGLAEAVLVRCGENGAVPIAGTFFPLQALAQADGWVLVPPESEGYPAGASVDIRPLP
ncbi:MAG: molybdopterin-binding protein [Variibacter sp.]|nr:molybdopterin-binding protein [Variibacter sp.]